MAVSYTLTTNPNNLFTLVGNKLRTSTSPIPAGTYNYVVRATDENGWVKDYNGVVTILGALPILSISSLDLSERHTNGKPIGNFPANSQNETRTIISSDDKFYLDSNGFLFRGPTALSNGLNSIIIRQARGTEVIDTAFNFTYYATKPETNAFVGRMSSSPSDDLFTSLNVFYSTIVDEGILDKADIINLSFPGREQDHRLNLKNSNYTLAPVGGPLFDSVSGCYVGANNAYLNFGSGLNLSTAVGLNAKVSDISVSWWSMDASAGYIGGTNNLRLGGIVETTSAGGKFGAVNMRLNSASTASTGNSILQPYDLYTMNRPNSAGYTLMAGATPISNTTITNTAFDNANFTLLSNPNISSYGSSRIPFFMLGASLTERQQLILRHAVRKYLMSVGVVSSTSVTLNDASQSFSVIGDTNKRFTTQSASKSWSFFKDGGKMRFDVRAGDFWSGDTSNDRNRSEIVSSSRWGRSSDVWIYYTLVLPPECDVIEAAKFFIVGQLHDDDSLGASPSWAFILADNQANRTERLRLRRLWDTNTSLPITFREEILYEGPNAPLERNKRFDLVFRLRFKQDNTGVYQCWINGTQVINLTATNIGLAQDQSAGLYPKMGIYRGLSVTRSVAEVFNFRMSENSLADYITNPLPIFR